MNEFLASWSINRLGSIWGKNIRRTSLRRLVMTALCWAASLFWLAIESELGQGLVAVGLEKVYGMYADMPETNSAMRYAQKDGPLTRKQ